MESEELQKIKVSVQNGLGKPSIEALLGRKFTPEEFAVYKKAKAIYDMNLRKRRSERKYEHLTDNER